MVAEPVNEPPALIVLHDGACPLCRRETGAYSDLKPNLLVCATASLRAPTSPISA